MVRFIKWLKIIIGITLGVHFFIFIALIFQEPLLFRSKSVSDNYKFKILVPHKEYIWTDTTAENPRQIYNAIYAPRKKVNGYIFYLHGTSNNVEYHTQFIPYYTDRDYEVWMMDYSGFGKSRGDRNENNLYADASRMFDTFALQYQLNPKDIIIVGKDLGTGLASKLAAEKNTEKLVLISPYNDLVSLYKDYIPWFPFQLFLNYSLPNDQHLKSYQGETGIFFGSNAMFIPYRNARRLQGLLKPGDEFHEYSEKLSFNVVDEKNFQDDLLLFLKK